MLDTMFAALIAIVFSTGSLSSRITGDEDFFNEPSTLQIPLTAAAVAKDSPRGRTGASAQATTYQVIAGGMPGASIHHAAPSA